MDTEAMMPTEELEANEASEPRPRRSTAQLASRDLALTCTTTSDEEAGFGLPAERWAPVGAACSPPEVMLPLSPATGRSEPCGASRYGGPWTSGAGGGSGSAQPMLWLPLSSSPSSYFTSSLGTAAAAVATADSVVDLEVVRRLEEEREQLDASLLALTAHFAHVQLRLRQVSSCPDPALKDTLLKELEEFASKGVPDVSVLLPKPTEPMSAVADCGEADRLPFVEADRSVATGSTPATVAAVPVAATPTTTTAAAAAAATGPAAMVADERLRERQRAALEQLRAQLSELEAYAYEVGVADDLPTATRVEKQSVIIEELQKKLHLSELENLATLSPERLRSIVDAAIAEIVNPAKIKEKVVEQLKTQVTDLERFVQFLQAEIDSLPRPPTHPHHHPTSCPSCVCHQPASSAVCDDGSNCDHNGSASSRAAAKKQRSCQNGSSSGGSKSRGASGRTGRPDRGPGDGSSLNAAAEATEPPVGASATRKEATKVEAGHDRLSVLKRLLLVLQAFVISELGCGGGRSDGGSADDSLQSSFVDRRWGILQSRMELTINELLSLASSQAAQWGAGRSRRLDASTSATERGAALAIAMAAGYDDEDGAEDGRSASETDGSCSDEEVFESVRLSQDMTRVVRRQLAPALQQLLEHGLCYDKASSGQSVVLWSFANCFSGRSRAAAVAQMSDAVPDGDKTPAGMHAWSVVVLYYELKRGREYTESPACKLSASFGLPVGDGRPTTVRQSLLRAVGDIMASHEPFRRSFDSHFKAFVCRALNERKLAAWLRLIVKTAVASDQYAPRSYVCSPGFEDVLTLLDRLTQHAFNLPVDLAVRRLSSFVDAF